MQRVFLKELRNHHDRRSHRNGPDDLIGGRHAELGVPQFQFLDGVTLRTAFLDGHIQFMRGKNALCIRIQISGDTGVKQPFQTVCHRVVAITTGRCQQHIPDNSQNPNDFSDTVHIGWPLKKYDFGTTL